MTKIELGIIKALSRIFFERGYDRECKKHDLEYWNVEEKDLACHCKQCLVYDAEYERYLINTMNINGSWCVRLFCISCDDDERDVSTLVYIPVNPNSLCWEISECANLIHIVITDRMNLMRLE